MLTDLKLSQLVFPQKVNLKTVSDHSYSTMITHIVFYFQIQIRLIPEYFHHLTALHSSTQDKPTVFLHSLFKNGENSLILFNEANRVNNDG
jgi:hypothetical protein